MRNCKRGLQSVFSLTRAYIIMPLFLASFFNRKLLYFFYFYMFTVKYEVPTVIPIVYKVNYKLSFIHITS